MPLCSPNPFYRERVLVIGPEKSGKSTSWGNMALNSMLSWSQRPDLMAYQPTFHVIDNDRGAGRQLTTGIYQGLLRDKRPVATELERRYLNPNGNCILYECFQHEDVEAALQTIMREVRPDDVIVIDMIHYTWQWAQDYYARTVVRKDLQEHRMKALAEAKAKGKKAPAVFDHNDWGGIKGEYNSVVRELMMKCPCHLFCTSAAEPVSEDEKSQAVRVLFGGSGIKPQQAEKNLGYQVRTILCTTKMQIPPTFEPYYYLTTIGDTQRQFVQQAPLREYPGQGDFTQVYLLGVAGWQA